jgi:coenzyme F420 biosynthesis associated uncharacterized protein
VLAGRDAISSSYLGATLERDFAAVTEEAEGLVAELTGLRAPTAAQGGVLDRNGWIDANLESMRRLISPLADKLGGRVVGTPLAPLGRRVTGTEMGVLLGYMAQRVLGQYDLLVPEEGAADVRGADGDAVYYVGPNILALEKRFAFRPVEFRRWIALHELTHRAQFTGVPWLRTYFMELVDGLLGSIEPDPRVLIRAAARVVEALASRRHPLDDAGLVGLVASDAQRAVLDRVQALMTLLEGHGNWVMNELGSRHVAGADRMARVLDARRSAGGVRGQVNKLLGMEMKLRQYEVGERFVEAVVAAAGPRAIDAAWRSPDSLPTLVEITDAHAWLSRVDAAVPRPA